MAQKCKILDLVMNTKTNNNSELWKWLKLSFGLHLIDADDVEECFVEEVIAEAPLDERCSVCGLPGRQLCDGGVKSSPKFVG